MKMSVRSQRYDGAKNRAIIEAAAISSPITMGQRAPIQSATHPIGISVRKVAEGGRRHDEPHLSARYPQLVLDERV